LHFHPPFLHEVNRHFFIDLGCEEKYYFSKKANQMPKLAGSAMLRKAIKIIQTKTFFKLTKNKISGTLTIKNKLMP